MPTVRAVNVSKEDRLKLNGLLKSGTTEQRLIRRISIVLAAAEGLGNDKIAERRGCNIHTVRKWRNRWIEEGLEGLKDSPGRGRKAVYAGEEEARIIAETLKRPDTKTHWSARRLSKKVAASKSTIHRIWKRNRLQPHRQETFKYSNDPRLAEKVVDVTGLYLNPPDKAIVLCVDEKSQIQALNRTQPLLPMKLGHPECRTHDYRRNGTTTLFAALDVAAGKVIGKCKARHRHEDFLDFLRFIERNYHTGDIHIVLDNYATHKHEKIERWLARRQRFHFHFTPTSASWMNQVETWFSILTRQAVRRGSFDNVQVLIQAIHRFIDSWNKHRLPFKWVKTPDQILAKAIA